jgi:hypothetical protein
MKSLLTPEEFSAAHRGLVTQDGMFRFTIQNLGETNIFYENGFDATVENGTRICPGAIFVNSSDNLTKVRLISEGSTNDQIRISIS